MINLLFIDDDHEILEINRKYFSNQGYTVKTAQTALEGIRLLRHFKADCLVLDVMLPEINGFKACKQLKTVSNAPIIFLTGCTSEDNRIKGLLLGGDDYVLKPYSIRELDARIQVQIRKSKKSLNNSLIISSPPLFLHLAEHKAYYNEEEIFLTNKEYDLLYLLMSHPNQLLTFEEIGQLAWGEYLQSDRRTIMVTASRLRKKLSSYNCLSEVIETVWSKGYKFKMRST